MTPMQHHNDALNRFVRFIIEREKIRLKKLEYPVGPWTEDPILRTFRFCNVNRQHDTVTIFIQDFLKRMFSDMAFLECDLILTATMCRLFNLPSSIAKIGPLRCGTDIRRHIGQALEKTPHCDTRVFNSAYIVSTNGKAMDKVDYVCQEILHPLAAKLPWVPLFKKPCRIDYTCKLLTMFNGIGDFIANQIATDLKYVAAPWTKATDWTTFVLGGPGTQRGLARLLDGQVGRKRDQSIVQAELLKIRSTIQFVAMYDSTLCEKDTAILEKIVGHFNDINNLSNCFCEWDKYERARLGQGRPKQLYRGVVL